MFYKAEFNECLLINVIKDIHTSAMSFWGNTCTVNVKGHHSIVIIKKLKHIFVVQLDITNPYLCTALSSDLLQDVFKTRCSVKLLTKLKETPQCTFHKIITPHMGSEGRLYSSKSTNGGKGLQNSKINSYFTP